MLGRDGGVPCAHCKAAPGAVRCVACDLSVCAGCVDDWKACSVPRPRRLRLERGRRLITIDGAGRYAVVTRRGRPEILDLARHAWRSLPWSPPRWVRDAAITSSGYLATQSGVRDVTGLAFSNFQLHDLKTGERLRQGLGTEQVHVSADERRLWAEDRAEKLNVLDLDAMKVERFSPLPREVIQASALLEDGRALVGTFGRVDLVDLEAGRTLSSCAVEGDCLWIAAAGTRAVVHSSAGATSRLVRIDLDGGQLTATPLWSNTPSWTDQALGGQDPDMASALRRAAIAPDGAFVAFAWYGHQVVVVGLDHGEAMALTEHRAAISALRLCDRGRMLVSADVGGLVFQRPVVDGRIITAGAIEAPPPGAAFPINAPENDLCGHCGAAPGERPCASCGVAVCPACLPDWHGCPGARARRLRLGLGARLRAADGAGTLGLVSGALGRQRLVDLRTGEPRESFGLPRRGPDQFLTRDGRMLALEILSPRASALVSRTVDGGTMTIIDSWRYAGVYGLGVSDDDAFAWLQGRNGRIVLIDLATQRTWSVPTTGRGPARAWFDAPNRRLAVAAGGDLELHLLEPDGLRRTGVLPYGGRFEWLHLTGDRGAGIVARPHQEPLLMTWTVADGVPRPEVPDLARVPLPAVAAANHRFVAAAGRKHRIIVQDRETGKQHTLLGHTDPVSYLRFADDGVLIAGDDDNRVWLRPHRDGRFVGEAITLPR